MVEKALPEVEGREGPFQRAEGSVPEASRMTRSVQRSSDERNLAALLGAG